MCEEKWFHILRTNADVCARLIEMIGGRDRFETDWGNERRRQLSAVTTGPEEPVVEVVSHD